MRKKRKAGKEQDAPKRDQLWESLEEKKRRQKTRTEKEA